MKGYLDAQGTLNGDGVGNPNAEFSPDVSTIEIYPSTSSTSSSLSASSQLTTRVAWGFLDGTVACTTAPKVMSHDKNARSAKFSRCRIQDAHQGSVTSIAFGEETIGEKMGYDALTFVSGCTKGLVKLWESKRMTCLWGDSVSFASKVSSVPSLDLHGLAILRVAYDAAGGRIVAALRCGDVIVWFGPDLRVDAGASRLTTVSPFTVSMPFVSLDDPRLQFSFLQCHRIPRPTTGDSNASTPTTDPPIPSSLFIQTSETRSHLFGGSVESVELQIGICYAGDTGFYRLTVDLRSIGAPQGPESSPSNDANIIRFSGASVGGITALAPNLVPLPRTLGRTSVNPDAVSILSTLTSPKAVDFPSISAGSEIPLSLPLSNSVTFDGTKKPCSFVIGGDALGFINIWEWDAEERVGTNRDPIPVIKARYRWEAHDEGSVTAVGVNEIALVTGRYAFVSHDLRDLGVYIDGSSRGAIRLWNLLTFEHIRSFSLSSTSTRSLGHVGHNDASGLEKVSYVILTHNVLIASAGKRVMAWRALLGSSEAMPISKTKGKKKTGHAAAKWRGKL